MDVQLYMNLVLYLFSPKNCMMLSRLVPHNLRPYDIDSNHYGPISVIDVMKKFPEEFRSELSRQIFIENLDLAKLLEVFYKELAPRERCHSIKSFESFPQIIWFYSTCCFWKSQWKSTENQFHLLDTESLFKLPPFINDVVPLLQMFHLEKKLYKKNLNTIIFLKPDTQLKLAHLKIVVLLVKSIIKFLCKDLKFTLLRKITHAKTRHFKMKL